MKLVVVGTGYVGLVTGACFAHLHHEVVCVDIDRSKIQSLRRGKLPIFEPDLDDLVTANCEARRLSFSSDLKAAARDADAVFIAVGTPSRAIDGHADLSFVFAVVREMATALPPKAVIAVKSTVPVGTGDEIALILKELRDGDELSVVSNPEFLRAGSAIKDFMQPDRIVIGADDTHATEVMQRIYAPLQLDPPLVFTARRSSELIKYGANALLATKIAFINEMADLCERTGADVQEVAKGIGMDQRIGLRFLQAGPGFGGSCFRKDALALVKTGEDHDVSMRIAEAVVTSNECRKRKLLQKVSAAVGGTVRNKTVAVWGLTFKANTDDLRESPAIPLITALLDGGARVQAYDPEGMPSARKLWPDQLVLTTDALAAARRADVLVIMTEWREFGALDVTRLLPLMARPVIVDMRNLYPAEHMQNLGFTYHPIGRGPRAGKEPSFAAKPANAQESRPSFAPAHQPRQATNGREPAVLT
jgi:UDPglucose 6-dehydrogenase